jgi:hypothetical protein
MCPVLHLYVLFTRTVFYWASTFPCNNTQLVIDNVGYIYYDEAWILGHQNNAKQFTMMQQICANGPLHIPEECVILAEYIYRNRNMFVFKCVALQLAINDHC